MHSGSVAGYNKYSDVFPDCRRARRTASALFEVAFKEKFSYTIRGLLGGESVMVRRMMVK